MRMLTILPNTKALKRALIRARETQCTSIEMLAPPHDRPWEECRGEPGRRRWPLLVTVGIGIHVPRRSCRGDNELRAGRAQEVFSPKDKPAENAIFIEDN